MARVSPDLLVKRRQIVIGTFQNLAKQLSLKVKAPVRPASGLRVRAVARIWRIWTSMSAREPFRRLRLQ